MLQSNRFHFRSERPATWYGQARSLCVLAVLLTATASARAHDTWVQVSSRLVRPDDVVHADAENDVETDDRHDTDAATG